MNFTREWHSAPALRLALIGALASLALICWSALGTAGAYDGARAGAQAMAPAQEGGGGPEANLPFLFAVFIITWAAFFAYVFYVSRRQREMQGEIEALKRALEERDAQASAQED